MVCPAGVMPAPPEGLRVLVVSTPVGVLGSGEGGGIELTLATLVAGLLERGHQLTVLAPEGSRLPSSCRSARLWEVGGIPQASWQHRPRSAAVEIPVDALLPRLWRRALEPRHHFDAILNLSYDWLPFWLTPSSPQPICHLVSMGSVSEAMDGVIQEVAAWKPVRLAFHTAAQAADFSLPLPPRLVGNGLDLRRYRFCPEAGPVLGWAGRIAPEKGLEDAVRVAARLGLPLRVWGVSEDPHYRREVEAVAPAGTIQWQGFLPTDRFQEQLGRCAVFLNTPKWNEAFGNVVIEAMACGVPVAAYERGGPGELVHEGVNGALASPDDVPALADAVARAGRIERRACRAWVERHHAQDRFAERIEAWLQEVVRG